MEIKNSFVMNLDIYYKKFLDLIKVNSINSFFFDREEFIQNGSYINNYFDEKLGILYKLNKNYPSLNISNRFYSYLKNLDYNNPLSLLISFMYLYEYYFDKEEDEDRFYFNYEEIRNLFNINLEKNRDFLFIKEVDGIKLNTFKTLYDLLEYNNNFILKELGVMIFYN